jgi:16S rRNA (guanine966-N2)-methyltransferase
VRIIAGEFRSRKLKAPPLRMARPTKDRVREAVFSAIAGWVENSRVLDLFSGSGAYGLEALSRGAAFCAFVDNAPECTGIIRENVEDLGLEQRSVVKRMNATEYLESLKNGREKFDIVFSDPPYGAGIFKNILIMIERYDILGDSGLLIAEHDSKESVPEKVGDLSLYKQKSYGITSVSIFVRSPKSRDIEGGDGRNELSDSAEGRIKEQ